METPLTILYTHRLLGDLDALPKLYSFLRQLQAHYSESPALVCADDPAAPVGSVLRLDLGESCDPSVWHCDVSGGRSTLVVLDGMGFDAARVDNAAVIRAQMGDAVRLALVDGENPHRIEDVVVITHPSTPSPFSYTGGEKGNAPRPVHAGEGQGDQRLHGVRGNVLQINLTPAETTHLDGDRLYLAGLAGSEQVGVAQLTRIIDRWALVTHEIHDLPRRALPDPTIAASVDFVLSEARYAQKRRSS
ncbi:MAG: hypothetical protein IT319_01685 [Anaerolineae bacterium]|nr:hypothetical protein [Anaerolineae bacterium]